MRFAFLLLLLVLLLWDTDATRRKIKRKRKKKQPAEKQTASDEGSCPAGQTCSDKYHVGAIQRKRAFSSAEIANILAVEKQVWDENADLSNKTRVFGEQTENSAGHTATYLHAHMGSTPEGQAVLEKLLHLTMELEKEAGWGIASSGLFKTPLHRRSVESIRYNNGDPTGLRPDTDAGAVETGWHSDFMSVMTISIMLSPSEDYSGGDFQTRRLGPDDGTQSYELDQGDVTLWKSWDRHRVTPMVGRRHVLVVQWWLAPAHLDPSTGPAPAYHFTQSPDLLLPYCAAITSKAVDSSSFYAWQICGKFIGKVATNTNEPELFRRALKYHRRAARIARDSVMLRQPLLSLAGCMVRIHFPQTEKPKVRDIHRVLKLCERVHKLGEALEPGQSPFDKEMEKDDDGEQMDLGTTVLHFLKQVIGHPALNLGPHSKYIKKYPFLNTYWST